MTAETGGAWATVRLGEDLAAVARGAGRRGRVAVRADRRRSLKDAVESCGVPHTEVDLLLVDGASARLDARVRPGTWIDALGWWDPQPRIASRVRPTPPPAPRFLLDVHLGRLAERLRLLGLDADRPGDVPDRELAERSAHEQRWLLTRDRGLLMRRVVVHGYLVRAHVPDAQLPEVVTRFGLAQAAAPRSRCAACNGPLASVAKAEVADRLEPGTRAAFDAFSRCERCGKVYWRGAHDAGLQRILDAVRAR